MIAYMIAAADTSTMLRCCYIAYDTDESTRDRNFFTVDYRYTKLIKRDHCAIEHGDNLEL